MTNVEIFEGILIQVQHFSKEDQSLVYSALIMSFLGKLEDRERDGVLPIVKQICAILGAKRAHVCPKECACERSGNKEG